jgi:hypothetical protein
MTQTCTDFADVNYGLVHWIGDVIKTAGIKVTVQPFKARNGRLTKRGMVAGFSYSPRLGTAGPGRTLNIYLANLSFDFGEPIKRLTLYIENHGDFSNLIVNTERKTFQTAAELHGAVIGGVRLEHSAGWLKLEGQINEFIVGGRNVEIESLCWEN